MAAVNRAAMRIEAHRPRLISLEYVPDGPIEETVMLVGKGIVLYNVWKKNRKKLLSQMHPFCFCSLFLATLSLLLTIYSLPLSFLARAFHVVITFELRIMPKNKSLCFPSNWFLKSHRRFMREAGKERMEWAKGNYLPLLMALTWYDFVEKRVVALSCIDFLIMVGLYLSPFHSLVYNMSLVLCVWHSTVVMGFYFRCYDRYRWSGFENRWRYVWNVTW